MSDIPLGKEVGYSDNYEPTLLYPIERQQSRDSLGLSSAKLPFYGVDIWNAYELSWLNPKGKPVVAWAEFIFPCDSASIVESKSFKLYLNSFNQTSFKDFEQVQKTLSLDLSACVKANVEVNIHGLSGSKSLLAQPTFEQLQGQCLDGLDVVVDTYSPDIRLLQVNPCTEAVERQVYSHLLRSLCPVTGQPDWGSVQISYTGHEIDAEGLLKYLVGYRQHQDFHEHCVERIFSDILSACSPQKLSVYARYVRRGGLDINPFRSSNTDYKVVNSRLLRQ